MKKLLKKLLGMVLGMAIVTTMSATVHATDTTITYDSINYVENVDAEGGTFSVVSKEWVKTHYAEVNGKTIRGLKTRNNEQDRRLATLETTLETQKAQINNLSSQLNQLGNRTTVLESKVTALENAVLQTNASIQQLATATTVTIENLAAKTTDAIVAVNAAIANVDVKTDANATALSSLEQTVRNYKKEQARFLPRLLGSIPIIGPIFGGQ